MLAKQISYCTQENVLSENNTFKCNILTGINKKTKKRPEESVKPQKVGVQVKY